MFENKQLIFRYNILIDNGLIFENALVIILENNGVFRIILAGTAYTVSIIPQV
jgi:hypothetical protein